MQDRYHIIKRGNGWAVKKEGSLRAVKIYKDKDEATKDAQKYRISGNDLIIHNKDGSVEKWLKKKQKSRRSI